MAASGCRNRPRFRAEGARRPGRLSTRHASSRWINAGQQAHYSFPEPVTLYVTYRTVTVGTDGTPVFRDDVYGRDKRVVAAMAKPRS